MVGTSMNTEKQIIYYTSRDKSLIYDERDAPTHIAKDLTTDIMFFFIKGHFNKNRFTISQLKDEVYSSYNSFRHAHMHTCACVREVAWSESEAVHATHAHTHTHYILHPTDSSARLNILSAL